MDEATLRRVVGSRFPGGRFTIAPHEHWLTCDAILTEPTREGVAHPMYVYYAALGGMGISLDELFALVGATADDGVMFGEAAIEIARPLAVGATYEVRGEVTGAERKSGRRAGVFDIVTFALEVVDEHGELCGTSTNSFVFPRRDLSP
jgi:acyl dehydratase